MRHRSSTTLAVTLVSALFCLAGTATASATVLCRVNAACTGADVYPSGTTVSAGLSGTAVFAFSGGVINPRITCTASTLALRTTAMSGTPLPANLTGLTFSGCTSTNPAGCSASFTITGLPTVASFAATGAGNGTVTIVAPRIAFTCPLGTTRITCTYGGNTITAAFTGGNPARIAFLNQRLSLVTGSACSTAATFTATYNTTGGVAYFLV